MCNKMFGSYYFRESNLTKKCVDNLLEISFFVNLSTWKFQYNGCRPKILRFSLCHGIILSVWWGNLPSFRKIFSFQSMNLIFVNVLFTFSAFGRARYEIVMWLVLRQYADILTAYQIPEMSEMSFAWAYLAMQNQSELRCSKFQK